MSKTAVVGRAAAPILEFRRALVPSYFRTSADDRAFDRFDIGVMAAAATDDQLRTGLRMIESAYVDRTRALESELDSLRAWAEKEQEQRAAAERRARELEVELRAIEQRGHESQRSMVALEQRYNDLQRESAMLRSADQRNNELQRENASLQSQVSMLESEKQQLELTIRTLQKDVTKLDRCAGTGGTVVV